MNTITKRWLCMLVVMAMVLSMSPVITLPAAAAVTNPGAALKATVDQWEKDNASKFEGQTGNVTATCPICGGEQTWEPLTGAHTAKGDHHFYLPAKLEFTSQNLFNHWSNTTTCVYMNNDITSTGNIKVYGTVNMFGSGTFTYSGGNALSMFEVNSTIALNIFSGTYTNTAAAGTSNASLAMIGAMKSAPVVNIYGGTFNTGDISFYRPYNYTTGTGTLNIYGGEINGGDRSVLDMSVADAQVNMYAGTIKDGNSLSGNGGNVNMTCGTFNMFGGSIENGKSLKGGANVYLGAGTFTMTGGEIKNGVTSGGGNPGGNVLIKGGAFNMEGGKISGGSADNRGGNICADAGTLTITGGEIFDGTATGSRNAGNIYTNVATTISDAKIYNGTAGSKGGNLYADLNAVVTMTDCEIYDGTAASEGDNVYLYGAEMTMNGGSVTAADGSNGNAIYVCYKNTEAAKLTLSGDATVVAETNPNEAILIYNGSEVIDTFEIAADWNGTAYVDFRNSGLTCGNTVPVEKGWCDAAGFTGELYIRGIQAAGENGMLVLSDHDYKVEITTKPTCGAAGEKTYTCNICGDSYTEAIPATQEHNYTSAVTKDPTCTEAGIRTYTCSACGDNYTEQIAELSHTAGTPVMENLNVAGEGHYELVTYCSVCKVELSRTPGVLDGSEKDLYVTYLDPADRVNAWVTANSGASFSSSYCPHCNETVIWEARTASSITSGYGIIGTSTATHIYLADNIDAQALSGNFLDGGSAHAVCLYLNGKNVTVNSGFYTRHTLSIFGNGTVTRKADTTSAATTYGMFRAHTTGTYRKFNIYGGTYINEHSVRMFDNTNSVPVNIYGGEFTSAAGTYVLKTKAEGDASGGSLNIYGGVINGGIVLNRDNLGVNMYGGTINGVDTASGGAIYMTASTFNMYGGTINGANVTNSGGAVYMAGGSFNMYDGTINGGTVTGSRNPGGAVHIVSGTFTMEGGTIQNGTAPFAGNVSVYGGSFTMTGGTLAGGFSSVGGGNLYARNDAVINIGGTAMIKEGKGTGAGDNINLGLWDAGKRPTLNITGGTICDGETDNVQVNGGHVSMTGGQIIAKDNPGQGQMGNALNVSRQGEVSASMILGGSAVITSRNATPHNVFRLTGYVNSGGVLDTLHINADWSGTAYLYVGNVTGGETLSSECITFDSGFTGKLYVVGAEIRVENNSLIIPGGAAVITANGSTWFPTVEEAIAEYLNTSGSAYIQMNEHCELNLGSGTYYIDANGKNITVNLQGKVEDYWITQVTKMSTLYMLDSANNKYDRYGSWTVNTGDYSEVYRDATNPVNGYRYFTIDDDNGVYTTHRIDIKLTAVTLRPSAAGLYYKASYACDAKLASRVTMYGVALSATDMPGSDFKTASGDAYSYITSGFTPDVNHTVAGNSCALFGIMKEDYADIASRNQTQGETTIYANPYITVDVYNTLDDTDDVEIMGDTENAGTKNGTGYSLLDILQFIDTNWNYYSDQQQRVMEVYKTWKDWGVDWDDKFAYIDGDASNMTSGEAVDKLTWDKINSIPMANNDMTEEELRQICIDYMRLQLTFAWKPHALTTFTNSSSNTKHFYPGAVYGGLPYVTSSFGNLYKVMEFYDPETGILDLSGGDATFKTIGNQCSAATFWAWNRVCASLTYQGTSDAVLKNGCIPLVEDLYDESVTSFTSEMFDQMFTPTNEQKIFAGYAALKPADGLVNNGHMRMVAVEATVVYNADGTINGAESKLVYLDQIASWSDSLQSDNKTPYKIEGGLDVIVTFEELFADGYIPFTIAELNKTASVEAGNASLNLNGQTNVSASTLARATLTSNYAISNIEVVVKNAGGETVYTNTTLPNSLPRTYAMSNAFDATVVAELAGNGATIQVNVRIGSGELIEVYTGDLTA